MKFSILIANYNNGKFFQTCYNHLITQEYDNWEAVILDDKSTDNSIEIITQMIKGDPRFRLYQNDVNCGVGITKAKLIDLASGEICGFVDPDDAIKETAISSAIAVFKKYPKTVLTYSRFIYCDENLEEIKKSTSQHQPLNGDLHFFNCPNNINHFVCFRKSVYEKTEKMDTTKKIAEDQDLYLKLFEMGNVKFIDEYNYLYRIHHGGISQFENKKKSYEYWAQVIFAAMKRRNLKKINGKRIPDSYTNSEEIFQLLLYQQKIPYRIWKKIMILRQNLFGNG